MSNPKKKNGKPFSDADLNALVDLVLKPSKEIQERNENMRIEKLRDRFAELALSRLFSSWDTADSKSATTCARRAYRFADAMIRARNNPSN